MDSRRLSRCRAPSRSSALIARSTAALARLWRPRMRAVLSPGGGSMSCSNLSGPAFCPNVTWHQPFSTTAGCLTQRLVMRRPWRPGPTNDLRFLGSLS